jgi:hypothetical protein
MLTQVLRFPLPAVGVLVGLILSGCQTGGDPQPEAKPEPNVPEPISTVPAGWISFDFDVISGFAPSGWAASTFSREELIATAEASLALLNLSDEGKQAARDLDLTSFPEFSLTLKGPGEIAVINVQPCLSPATLDLRDLVARYARIGLDAEDVGVARTEGGTFPIFKVAIYPQADAYQVYFGDDCTSQATLVTEPGDTTQLDDFKTVLQHLTISERGAATK